MGSASTQNIFHISPCSWWCWIALQQLFSRQWNHQFCWGMLLLTTHFSSESQSICPLQWVPVYVGSRTIYLPSEDLSFFGIDHTKYTFQWKSQFLMKSAPQNIPRYNITPHAVKVSGSVGISPEKISSSETSSFCWKLRPHKTYLSSESS